MGVNRGTRGALLVDLVERKMAIQLSDWWNPAADY